MGHLGSQKDLALDLAYNDKFSKTTQLTFFLFKNKWPASDESQTFCSKPVAPCEVTLGSFRFRDFSSSFLTANDSLFGRGSKCPGVGGGLLEKYGIFKAYRSRQR